VGAGGRASQSCKGPVVGTSRVQEYAGLRGWSRAEERRDEASLAGPCSSLCGHWLHSVVVELPPGVLSTRLV
jgi:hypothetical protein